MNRTQKEGIVSELSDKFKGAAAIFLVDYCGLTVGEMTEIRRELDKVQTRIHVVKNRLVKRALNGEEYPGLVDYLRGPTAIAFVEEDPVGTAKVLAKYQKEFKPLEIRAGYIKGEVIGPEKVEFLSKLPSREELYAKLLGTLLAPASNLVRVIQGVSGRLVRVLDTIRGSKE